MDVKWVLTVNGIVCSFGMFFLTSAKGDGVGVVASLELDESAPAEGEDVCAKSGSDSESDSLGGWFVTVSVVVSSEGLAANSPFSLPVESLAYSDNRDVYIPERLSSLISP